MRTLRDFSSCGARSAAACGAGPRSALARRGLRAGGSSPAIVAWHAIGWAPVVELPRAVPRVRRRAAGGRHRARRSGGEAVVQRQCCRVGGPALTACCLRESRPIWRARTKRRRGVSSIQRALRSGDAATANVAWARRSRSAPARWPDLRGVSARRVRHPRGRPLSWAGISRSRRSLAAHLRAPRRPRRPVSRPSRDSDATTANFGLTAPAARTPRRRPSRRHVRRARSSSGGALARSHHARAHRFFVPTHVTVPWR